MSSGNNSNYFVHTLLRARDWQHRPQFDEVCDWWRGSSMGSQPVRSSVGRGVCALVGMGGAGKTAIADRFLNELLDDTSTTRQRVSPPRSVFVYSFYDDDKPENFFRHLQIWLEGAQRDAKRITEIWEKPLSPMQMQPLVQSHQGLIILDGLEKVQESGARGGFGRLTSPSLRDLLNHIASGSARELSVLVTSRFPLTDLRDSQPRYFHTIAVDQIDVAAGVQLLRTRGVRGPDVRLAPIVDHCGRHVLTIDLAGGYIKEYGHGDPSTPLNLGTAEELQAKAELEPDDDKRAVLKQGIRFARIAQRYREAMLNSDEAALALLERICLFRLGVDCETLAAIFTGRKAKKVAGKSLASLDAEELRQKLDWLVKMRILEVNGLALAADDAARDVKNGRLAPCCSHMYSTHPAIRDGFLSGIRRNERESSHEAIRRGLEMSLGDVPDHSPSDPPVLDLLEEIIHHALRSGHVQEAWEIYWNRIGNVTNLAWRLGAYERGERICREFTDGQSPKQFARTVNLHESEGSRKLSSPFSKLSSTAQGQLINDWGLYLSAVGRLADAANCYAFVLQTWGGTEPQNELSVLNQNLCEIQLAKGFLKRALETSNTAVQFAEAADHNIERGRSQAFWGRVASLCGDVLSAQTAFRNVQKLQSKVEHDLKPRPLHGGIGVWYSELLCWLGRTESATLLTGMNWSICRQDFGGADQFTPQCELLLCVLHFQTGDESLAVRLWTSARDWALLRDAKLVLCWSALVHARNALANPNSSNGERLNEVRTALANALKMTRDCGYSLYHIDLLLERARLQLLRGDARAALDDIELALDTGIPANEETGQVELLAANHEECGYAWAIPVGRQLRAEAMLLQAAQEVISVGWAVPTDGTLAPIDVDEAGTAHPTIAQLIDQAKQLLHEALDRWHDLRDPEPTEDNNFKLDGKEYNYRAAETHNVLVQLEGGVLTRYPLKPITISEAEDHQEENDRVDSTTRDQVFISYSHKDEKWLAQLLTHLKPHTGVNSMSCWSDQKIKPGAKWFDEIEKARARTKVAVFLVSPDFLASEFIQQHELSPLLTDAEAGRVTILWIPVRVSSVGSSPLNLYQALGDPGVPISELRGRRDKAWVAICEKIVAALNAE